MEIRALRPSDDRSAFRSGEEDLDRFLHRYAGQNQFRHHLGVTYVAVDAGRVLGFATVAPRHVEIEELPERERTRRSRASRRPGRGRHPCGCRWERSRRRAAQDAERKPRSPRGADRREATFHLGWLAGRTRPVRRAPRCRRACSPVRQPATAGAPPCGSRASRAASCVNLASVLSFFTAMASARRVPTSTTSLRARVMPV